MTTATETREEAFVRNTQLRLAAYARLLEAEKAWYAYFADCEVGYDRERAHEVYENIRCATRRSY